MRNYVQGQATLNLRFYQDKTAVLQQFSRIKIKSSPNACSPSISAFNCRVKRFFYFFAGFSGKETAGKITFRIRRTVSKSTPSDMHIKRIQRSRILRLRRVAQATFFHSAAVRSARSILSYRNKVSYTIKKQAGPLFQNVLPAVSSECFLPALNRPCRFFEPCRLFFVQVRRHLFAHLCVITV